MNELPGEIAGVLTERRRRTEGWDYSRARQSVAFLYDHDGEHVDLALFQSEEGALPVPQVGQTVTLLNKGPLIVDRVETDYGLGLDGEQHASVCVYVKLPIKASRDW